MSSRNALLAAILLLPLAQPAAGAPGDAPPGDPPAPGPHPSPPASAAKDSPATGADWFAFPVAFYTPETRLGFGGTGGVHFAAGPSLPTSDVQLIAVASVNRQAVLDLRSQLFLSGALALGGSLKLALFPDRFYGIGDDTPSRAREAFTARYLEAQLAPEWIALPRRLRTGPRLWFRRETFGGLAPGGRLAAGGMDGLDGYASAAAGWGATWDGRDNRFFPRSGTYLEAWFLAAPGAFGDRLRFGRGALDGRLFLPLGGALVLGLTGRLELAHGAVPFTLLPRLGGDKLRGYYEGRWRDRLLYTGQAELRFPVAGRLGGAAFAGLSDVARDPSAFRARTIRVAGGAGVRYRLTGDGLNIRLDAGAGGEGLAVYFALGEAF